MYTTPETQKHELLLEELESLELQFENIGHYQDITALHGRLCIELVDCEPSIY